MAMQISGPPWVTRITPPGVEDLSYSPSEQLGGRNTSTFRNPSTTRQTVYFPSGALSVLLRYRLLPGATATAGQFMKYVVNAASDADAAGRLATDGAYDWLCQGDDDGFGASASDPITRIDFQTAQAVGTEVTLFGIIAAVQS